jgi:hypothetical protein
MNAAFQPDPEISIQPFSYRYGPIPGPGYTGFIPHRHIADTGRNIGRNYLHPRPDFLKCGLNGRNLHRIPGTNRNFHRTQNPTKTLAFSPQNQSERQPKARFSALPARVFPISQSQSG